MRRIIDFLIAATLVAVPALALFTSAGAPSALAASHHMVAMAQSNSACAPDDPGLL